MADEVRATGRKLPPRLRNDRKMRSGNFWLGVEPGTSKFSLIEKRLRPQSPLDFKTDIQMKLRELGRVFFKRLLVIKSIET